LLEHGFNALDVPKYLLYLRWGSILIPLASACPVGENYTLLLLRVAANVNILGLAENGSVPPLATRDDEDGDNYKSFDPYATMDTMDEEDCNDMEDILRAILEMTKHTRAIKYTHDQMDPGGVRPIVMGRITAGERFASIVFATNDEVDCDTVDEAAGGTVTSRGTNVVVLDAGVREEFMALLTG